MSDYETWRAYKALIRMCRDVQPRPLLGQEQPEQKPLVLTEDQASAVDEMAFGVAV